jgi:tetratricopeptide (TPR) repeat protein
VSDARAAAPRQAWGYAAIALAFVAAFAPTAGYDLVWDDSNIAPSQERFADLAAGLRSTQVDQMDEVRLHTVGDRLPYRSYRPLLFASYRFDRALFGLAPWAMHLHSVLLGALNVVLFALLLGPAPLAPTLRLALTLAFALHPLQIEAVSYVSARGDLLAGTFALLALLAVQHSILRAGAAAYAGAAAAGACLLLSLFAKETYAGLPIAAALFAFAAGRLRRALPALAGMVLFSAAYAAIRLSVMGAGGAQAGKDSGVDLLLRVVAVVGQSVQVVALPLDLSIHRGAVRDFTALGVLVLVAGGAGLLARKASLAVALAGAAALSLYAVLAPSAVAVGSYGILSDRYLYAAVPLVLLPAALTLQACAARAWRVRLPAHALIAAWALTCAVVWPGAARAWRDELALYSHAVKAAPERTESWYRLGQLYAHRGDWARAALLLERAIALDPNNQRAHNNLGVVRLNERRFHEAVREFDLALRLTGGKHYKACFNKALSLIGLARRQDACAQLRACVAVNPAYEQPREALRQYCGAS